MWWSFVLRSDLVNNPSFKRGLSPRPRLATHLLLLPAPPDKMTSVVSVVVAWGRLQPSQRKYQNLLRYQNRKVDGRLVRKPVNFWLNFPSGEDIIFLQVKIWNISIISDGNPLADFFHLFYEEKQTTEENKKTKNNKKVPKLVVPKFPDSKRRKLVVPKFRWWWRRLF